VRLCFALIQSKNINRDNNCVIVSKELQLFLFIFGDLFSFIILILFIKIWYFGIIMLGCFNN
jgi:hypothetical protein